MPNLQNYILFDTSSLRGIRCLRGLDKIPSKTGFCTNSGAIDICPRPRGFVEGHDFSRAVSDRKKDSGTTKLPERTKALRPLTSLSPIAPPPCQSSPTRVIPSEVEGPCVVPQPKPRVPHVSRRSRRGIPLLRRHPYRSRHFDQFVRSFRHGRPSLKRPTTAKSKL
jgi:hypothetical protein